MDSADFTVTEAWMLTVTEASGGSPMSVDVASSEPYRYCRVMWVIELDTYGVLPGE